MSNNKPSHFYYVFETTIWIINIYLKNRCPSWNVCWSFRSLSLTHPTSPAAIYFHVSTLSAVTHPSEAMIRRNSISANWLLGESTTELLLLLLLTPNCNLAIQSLKALNLLDTLLWGNHPSWSYGDECGSRRWKGEWLRLGRSCKIGSGYGVKGNEELTSTIHFHIWQRNDMSQSLSLVHGLGRLWLEHGTRGRRSWHRGTSLGWEGSGWNSLGRESLLPRNLKTGIILISINYHKVLPKHLR